LDLVEEQTRSWSVNATRRDLDDVAGRHDVRREDLENPLGAASARRFEEVVGSGSGAQSRVNPGSGIRVEHDPCLVLAGGAALEPSSLLVVGVDLHREECGSR
jgi:hypothetical protein